MENEIISYIEMCQREGLSLQKGMNFLGDRAYAVVLMSLRPNAPYRDRIEDEGLTLTYEGHDVPGGKGEDDPKSVDQPEVRPSGKLTENGQFHRAAQDHKLHARRPRRVRVYEKIKPGIWSYNGRFRLVDSWREADRGRQVFKFKLELAEGEDGAVAEAEFEHRRLIPSWVKQEVWKRDRGQCVKCGEPDGLHFDHDLPFSKGGSPATPENIQLLCARHNLQKGAKIA